MAQRISASSNKRLAKNTVLLYMRTVVVIIISIFTSRVILQSLGIDDYGTYHVIGGFVAMFSMLGGTLVTATQRFINVELGKKEDGNPNEVFCTAMGIHIILAAVLFLALESFGLWFLNCKMNIPEERMVAAVKSCTNFSESNTQVTQANGNTYVYLFENCIYKIINGKRFFTLCGWNTPTTRLSG